MNIIYAFTAFFLFNVADAFLKKIIPHYSPAPVLCIAEATVVVTICLCCLATRQIKLLKPRQLSVAAIYSIFYTVNFTAFCYLLPRVPLAELFVLVMAIPLVIMFGARVFLGEILKPYQYAAILLGVAGVLLMMQVWDLDLSSAGQGARKWDALSVGIAILHVLTNAAQQLFTRRYASEENSFSLAFISALFMACVFGIWGYATLPEITVSDALISCLTGVISTFGTLLMIKAFQSGVTSLVAPVQYSQLLWATVFGYIFWHETPSAWAYAGGFLLLVSGYILYRRQLRFQK